MPAALISLVLFLLGSSAQAQELEPTSEAQEETSQFSLEIERGQMEEPEDLFEFSFGSSLLYVEQPLLDGYSAVQDSRVLPVPSVLILAEWLIRPRWTLAGLLNLPTGPIRVLSEDGLSYSEEASSAAVAIGGAYIPFQVRLNKKSLFQPQMGLMLGRSLNHSEQDTFFPLAVGRLHLHSGSGFSMYFGAAFAGRRDTLALIYGVGHRF